MKNIKKMDKKKDTIIVIVIFMSVIILCVGILGLNQLRNNQRYTNEEMLHDHDGDGLPDHSTNFH